MVAEVYYKISIIWMAVFVRVLSVLELTVPFLVRRDEALEIVVQFKVVAAEKGL